MDGLLAALASAGLQLPRELVLRGEGGYSFGMRAVGDWLRLSVERRPTAIVAFSDVIAIGAMQAVQAYGLRIGSDMAITGFDDMNLVRFLNPPLTSVRQPIWEVGQKITSMLLDRVVGKEPSESQVLLAPELIVRASSLCNDALCRTREVPDPGLRDIPTRDR
jgi:LacI family xylobiose transport system transcriptional regulator